ncbi:MAG: DUF4097 family beta strand repeat protein [Chloroflexi bacterium]|nr:DUF4097 family beta strand repeat protein [Chloroflexota bacterium]
MSENNNQEISSPQRNRRSFFWPIILISLGVLLLLSNLGIVAWTTWNLIWRFWPLILVAIGIDVLFGRRSTGGAFVSAFLVLMLIAVVAGAVFFADQLPVLSRFSSETPWQTSHVEKKLDDYESASIFIDWTSQPGTLYALDNSSNLIEGDLTYQGELIFDVKDQGSNADVKLDTRVVDNWGIPNFQINQPAEWDIALTPDIPLDLRLDTGSGSCEFDLADLMIEDLFLDSGSGSIKLSLPESQSFSFKLDSGSGSVHINLPGDTGMRVRLDSGSGSFNPGNDYQLVSGEKGSDGVWESSNYDSAQNTIEMIIDQGSGSINFK